MTATKMDEITEEMWEKVNPENRELCETFISESINLSDQTLLQYTSALRIFMYWLFNNKSNKKFVDVRPREFLQYQNYLVNLGLSSSAVRLKRAAISSLCNYILAYFTDEYPSFRSFVTKATPAPVQSFVNEKKPPTLAEMQQIYSVLEEKELWQVLAWVKFSFASGARRGEVRQLLKSIVDSEPKVKDVVVTDENGNKIVKESRSYSTDKLRGKGRGKIGKQIKLQCDEDAILAIKKWLEIRGEDDCEFVFVSKKDGKMGQVSLGTFNNWAETYVEPILGRRFHPHILRESRATSLVMEQGFSIETAQKLLHHESSSTTQIYVIREDSEDADDAFL